MVNFFENFREIFLHRLCRALELRQRVRPDGAAPFSAPAERGARTAAGGFALSGRLLSLHRLSGVLELPQAGSPLTGGEFFSTDPLGHTNCRRRVRPFRAESFSLNLSGGFAVCGRRERAAPRGGGKKEGQPAVFLPL